MKFNKTIHMLSAVGLMAMASLFTACSSDDAEQGGGNGKGGNIAGNVTIFAGEAQPTTRTTISHTLGSTGKVKWEATDKIWVKDNSGTFQQSAAATFLSATPDNYGRFAVTGTFTNPTHEVVYTNGSSATEVNIATNQTQSAPNNFDHAGASGDCGVATAHRSTTGDFGFTLDHKAAYLCFLPRSGNSVIAGCKLTKIEVSSDNAIAGTFNISSTGLTATPTSTKTITLTTGSGFDLDNTTKDINKNGSYMVIAPGTHTLTVRFWVKSTTDNIEAHITKYVQGTFAPGKIVDITSKLDNNYGTPKYYLWDAKKDLWDGLESVQPTTNGASASTGLTYQDGTDRNSGHIAGMPHNAVLDSYHASNTFKDQPNNNEIKWYSVGGDWYMDTKEAVVLMGHLYAGGFWCKKKAYISGFSSTTAPASYSGWGPIMTEGRPDFQDLNKYFYLPNLGKYNLHSNIANATFNAPNGIDNFLAWGNGIEDLVGVWNIGGIIGNDNYQIGAMGFYKGYASNSLYTHQMNEMLREDSFAAPIYKFE